MYNVVYTALIGLHACGQEIGGRFRYVIIEARV